MPGNNRPDIIHHKIGSNGQVFVRDQDIRGNQINTDDIEKVFTMGLADIDEAMLYHIRNKVAIGITVAGKPLSVPVIYADPEIAASISTSGVIRDASAQVMYPVIALKRTEIEKTRNMSSKLDANLVHNHYVYKQKYTSANSYNQFDRIQNRVPVESIIHTAIPDTVKVAYDCYVYTDFIDTNTQIIENFMYTSDSYWGDDEHNYRTTINVIPTETDYSNENGGRVVLSQFQITTFGYILPDSVMRQLNSKLKSYTKSVMSIKLDENL